MAKATPGGVVWRAMASEGETLSVKHEVPNQLSASSFQPVICRLPFHSNAIPLFRCSIDPTIPQNRLLLYPLLCLKLPISSLHHLRLLQFQAFSEVPNTNEHISRFLQSHPESNSHHHFSFASSRPQLKHLSQLRGKQSCQYFLIHRLHVLLSLVLIRLEPKISPPSLSKVIDEFSLHEHQLRMKLKHKPLHPQIKSMRKQVQKPETIHAIFTMNLIIMVLCISALNPDKWLVFKQQEKAKVSHNTQLYRLSSILHAPNP
ncbi:hypothetical protein LXL04_036371 [Taraxacum kok-saghyz]